LRGFAWILLWVSTTLSQKVLLTLLQILTQQITYHRDAGRLFDDGIGSRSRFEWRGETRSITTANAALPAKQSRGWRCLHSTDRFRRQPCKSGRVFTNTLSFRVPGRTKRDPALRCYKTRNKYSALENDALAGTIRWRHIVRFIGVLPVQALTRTWI
jgi:hypothetical protein